jgi:RNA polymerase sigma factor (sigma-70 family)
MIGELASRVNAGHARSVHGVMVRGAEDLLAEPVTDEAAFSFEAFFTSEQTRLLRAVYLLTGNVQEAEEIVQETFMAVWERWDRVRTMDEPVGYLYRAALNRHRSKVRRALRGARRAIGAAEGADLFAAADERDVLARAIATLTPRRREALVIVELLGHNSAEAGTLMGVSDVTVRRLVSEARRHLRHELGDDDDG